MEQQHIDTIEDALREARAQAENLSKDWKADSASYRRYMRDIDEYEAALEAVRELSRQIEARKAQPPSSTRGGERQLSTPHWVAASANDLGAIEAMLAGVNNPANHAHVRLWLDRAWQDAQHTPQPLPADVREAMMVVLKHGKENDWVDALEWTLYRDATNTLRLWLAQQPDA